MFDWIPLSSYTPIYHYTSLLVVVMVVSKSFYDREHITLVNVVGFVFFVLLLLYIGLRPVSGKFFTDMATYNRIFLRYQEGGGITSNKDVLFHNFTKFCSGIMNANTYFLVCATLYVVPLYVVCVKWFKEYWFYAFLLLAVSFSFWAYGTNGIRNGIATSLFLLAASRDKWLWRVIWFLLAINFHKTMTLPVGAYLLAFFYTKPRQFLYFWLACIPLSLVAGEALQGLFASFMEDDRATSYLTEGNINNDNFSSTGFRWDFLLYSATAVFTGWYFIIKKEYEDRLYQILFCTYVFANAFWILVIKANFSNRFAYLSWFMMALVIAYPFLKHKILPAQDKWLVYVILAYFAFTFLMNVILK